MKRDIFKHLSPVPRLAARILEKLDWWGGQMTKRELERKLSAHKELLWKQAWEHLISTGSIEVKAVGSRRQQIITRQQIPKNLQARTIEKRPKRKRPNRPRSQWFEESLPQFRKRDGYVEPSFDSEHSDWEERIEIFRQLAADRESKRF